MRRIRRGQAPVELTHWRNNQPLENGRRINCKYDYIDCKDIIRRQLLKEQGYLCGYTGIRIDEESSHIEHVKPQSKCDLTIYEDTFYENFIAAYPKNGSCEFGAKYRLDWYDEKLFITPFNDNCEIAFDFNLNGEINARNGLHSKAAEETIKKLALNHKKLTSMRKTAIQKALLDKSIKIIKLEHIIESYAKFYINQSLPEFCFVIVEAAKELLRKKRKAKKHQEYAKLGRKRRRR